MELNQFLEKFSEILKDKIKTAFQPVYLPSNESSYETNLREKVKLLTRQPFPKQMEAVLAIVKGFKKANHRGLFLVSEMGTGKTMMAICTAFLLLPEKSRTLILCPGHLVDKWGREIRTTVPKAIVVDINGSGLKELIDLKNNKTQPKGREFYIIGKERAKNHFARRLGIVQQKQHFSCPNCGEKFVVAPNVDKKPVCESCKSPLWQADKDGYNRYAKAEFIKRFLPKDTFDLFIADEVHQYKSGDSAQGQAFANLACKAKNTLCLTGTLMGGYSTNLFYLLWRIVPKTMKEMGIGYDNPMFFAEKYGVIERIEKEKLRDNAASIGGNSISRRVVEKPGISPTIFTDLLLQRAIFLKLEDITVNLPSFKEEVTVVQMDQEQDDAYKNFQQELQSIVRSSLARGDKTLLGILVNSLLAYPDGARKGEVVLHPRTQEFLCSGPEINIENLAKERKLVEILKEEKKQGRKCLVCLEHTGTRDLIPDLQERIEKENLSVLILRQNNPSAAKRESWLNVKLSTGNYDVLITNPRLIETGLDLLQFPTIIYFQTGYSTFTLRQSSRRSWRIGQDKPVKIYYMVYQNTVQETALSLMAEKMQVALAVEGDLSDKGLTALSNSDTSLLIKMAKTLIGEEKRKNIAQSWGDYLQQSVKVEAAINSNDDITTTETTTITVKSDTSQKEVSIVYEEVVRGKVYPQKNFAIAVIDTQTGSKKQFIFSKGSVLYNKKVIGNYDSKGKGEINKKPIKLVKDKDNSFLLIELKKAA
ncbi:MAG: DEAD/DEAH box helicase [Desulfobacterales bacterium]|nr:DEAD/DEAH box helicase [Desulfobacterales bacterium]